MSKTAGKYVPEVYDHAIRIVRDHKSDSAWLWATVVPIAAKNQFCAAASGKTGSVQLVQICSSRLALGWPNCIKSRRPLMGSPDRYHVRGLCIT